MSVLEEDLSDQSRRSVGLNWYSNYQSQVVGPPRSSWAPGGAIGRESDSDSEEKVSKRTEGHEGKQLDDDDGAANNREEKTESSKSNSKYASTNGKTSDDDERDDKSEKIDDKNRQMFRPFSMIDIVQMKQGTDKDDDDDGVGKRKINRSISTLNWTDVYEEYKPPKRYQKPTNIKINTRLSRTFITGTGMDKCKKCGSRLYEMEKIHANHFSYHRACFRCSKCQRLLNLGTFTSVDSQLFCKSCFQNTIIGNAGNQIPKDESINNNNLIDFNLGEEVSKEVSLASISNIKSRFEVPSKFDDIAAKNLKHQKSEADKYFPLQTPSEQKIHKEIAKTNDAELRITRESNHTIRAVEPSSMEIKIETGSNTKSMLEKESPQFKNSTGMFDAERSDDDEVDFKFADRIAKFRIIELQSVPKSPSKELKPSHKITIMKQQQQSKSSPETFRFFGPEKFTSGYENSGHFSPFPNNPQISNVKFDAKIIHNNKIPTLQHTTRQNHIENGNIDIATPDDEVWAAGITKRLRNHWEMKDVPDGIPHRQPSANVLHYQPSANVPHYQPSANVPHHQPSANVLHYQPSANVPHYQPSANVLHHRPSADVPLHRPGGNIHGRDIIEPNAVHVKATTLAADVHTANGFKAGDDVVSHKIEPIHRDGAHEKVHVGEHKDFEKTWIGPLDFTRNQLAKFKQLEATAQRYASPYTTKKSFRWGVKEVSPLHRPISYTEYDRTSSVFGLDVPDRTPPPPHLLFHQNHEWKSSAEISPAIFHDGHAHGRYSLPASFPPHVVGENQVTSLAPVKETLEQFKMLEDPSRPPPNPVLAMNQQKTAISAATKPYHDIIHVAYVVPVVAKD